MKELDLNKIYCEDCLETMKRMPDNFVDMTLTSPPYDNLRDYKGYSFNFESIAKELFRVTKQGGVVVWNVADATENGSETGTSFRQALFFKEIGFNLHDTMIWLRRTTPQTSNRYEPAFEYMFVFSKGKPKTFNPIKAPAKYAETRTEKSYHRDPKNQDNFTKNELKRYDFVTIGNAWDIPNRGHDKFAKRHPAIFPEKLVADHIKSWSNEGDLIYDPMIGSGTTGKMAVMLKRNYIGSEISAEYTKLAEERIKNISNPLFNPHDPKPKTNQKSEEGSET